MTENATHIDAAITPSTWAMRIASWAVLQNDTSLPPAVEHQMHRMILDYLGAALAGSRSEPAEAVHSYLREFEGGGSATVIGHSWTTSPANAALANGTAAHSLELDDGYTPGSFHPSSVVMPALLAAAEHLGAPKQRILRAGAVGLEVACRIAEAGHPATWKRGFHNTPIAGVFGAAVAVALLHGGDARMLSNAIGIAGSHAGGLFEFLTDGSEVKRFHSGKAARDGLISATLARAGLTGPQTVLEGAHGYAQAFAGGAFDVDALLVGLGQTWKIASTYIKPYPCCRHLHGAIDAILQLNETSAISPENVESIVVETYSVAARHGNQDIGNLLDAQMSLPYAVAASVVFGSPGLEAFGTQARDDASLSDLLTRVRVKESADLTSRYPSERPTRLALHERSGAVRHILVPQPLGEPSNPVSDSYLESKFALLAEPVIGSGATSRVLEQVWSLDEPELLYHALKTS